MAESPIKSSMNYLSEENERLRDNISIVKKEKDQMTRQLRKVQTQMKMQEMQVISAKSESQRNILETRRLRESLEQEKKEKTKLLTEFSEVRNTITRREVQISKLQAQNENLQRQTERLQKEVEEKSLSKVGQQKEKQSFLNMIKILQTKLEAAVGEKKFLDNKNKQLQIEKNQLKQSYSELQQKYHNKELGVQAIYRDDEKTKEHLLGQFQNKMSDKEQEMRIQIQKHLNENLELRRELRETKQQFLRT